MSRWLLAIVFGSVLCTLLDQLHVRFGVLTYRDGSMFGQAPWVPALFAVATLAGLLGYVTWARKLGYRRDLTDGPRDRWGTREAAMALAWMALAHALSGPLQHWPRALLVTYVAVFGLRCWSLGAPGLGASGLQFALGGTMFESMLASTGAFHYRHPDLWGVPLWLPGVYLHATPLLRAVLRRWLIPVAPRSALP